MNSTISLLKSHTYLFNLLWLVRFWLYNWYGFLSTSLFSRYLSFELWLWKLFLLLYLVSFNWLLDLDFIHGLAYKLNCVISNLFGPIIVLYSWIINGFLYSFFKFSLYLLYHAIFISFNFFLYRFFLLLRIRFTSI